MNCTNCYSLHTVNKYFREQAYYHIHKKAFRKWCCGLGELRSIFPNAFLLSLSVTCTLKVQKRVLKVVSFKPDFTFVYLSLDKRNIKYVVKKWRMTLKWQLYGKLMDLWTWVINFHEHLYIASQ